MANRNGLTTRGGWKPVYFRVQDKTLWVDAPGDNFSLVTVIPTIPWLQPGQTPVASSVGIGQLIIDADPANPGIYIRQADGTLVLIASTSPAAAAGFALEVPQQFSLNTVAGIDNYKQIFRQIQCLHFHQY